MRLALILKNAYIALLVFIFGGILLHTPANVGLGVIFPDFSLLIKSWKEILMVIAGLIAVYLLIANKRLGLLKDPIIVLIMTYVVLHLTLSILIGGEISSKLAGLAIDLRYVVFFGLVYVALKLWPNYRSLFVKVGIAGALLVVVFAILQVFVLPKDILKYLGYSANTVSPYMTVDQNPDFIRINSTMRGPNPLGAYSIIVLSLVVVFVCKFKLKINKWQKIALLTLSLGGLIAIWFSYSRSAIIAAALAVIIILLVSLPKKILSKKVIVGAVSLFVVFIIGLFVVFNNNYFLSNVLLHENPSNDTSINSNEGHLISLRDGLALMAAQPLGGGVGSTGSASLRGKTPMIIENQYLFIAHEAGWAGLTVFIFIFGLIMYGLWHKRKDWLALGIFASGIGLTVVGLLLPVWVDDVVSIVWWGLAAIALASGK